MQTESRSLSSLLGGSRELALFEAFALRSNDALDARQASQYSGVSWATVHRKIRDWESLGLLEFAWKSGKAEKYRLNLSSKTVQILVGAVRSAVEELLESDLVADGVSEDALTVSVGGTLGAAFAETPDSVNHNYAWTKHASNEPGAGYRRRRTSVAEIRHASVVHAQEATSA